MRGLRSFLGLLAILIGLGAYLYFVESKREPGDQGDKKGKVFAVEADKIDAVTVRSESGDVTTLKKGGNDWQITAPAAAQADAAEISGIATNLATLEEQRVIAENPGDLNDFGLAKPRIEIAFTSGGQEQKLLIGGKTPTGGDLYAKTSAQPKVFLIASYLDSTFNRSTFDLREKTALRFSRDGADGLEVTAGETPLKFGKVNGEWQLTAPPTPRTDAAAIESLLARLNGLQMKKLTAAEAVDLKPYGLDKPAASVQVRSGSSQAVLLLGAKADEGTVYAKDGSRPAVFTVESTLLDDLKKGAGEYRQKDVFDARAFNTTHVETVRGAEAPVVFEKAAVKGQDGREEQKWRQVAPAAKEIEGTRVDALLSSLTSLRAESFVDTPPAGAKSELSVALKFDEGRKEERVTFHRAGSDAFAVRDGGTAKIPATSLDEILKTLDSLK